MSGLSDVHFPGGVNRPTFDRSVHDPTSVREVERRKSCLQLARDSSGIGAIKRYIVGSLQTRVVSMYTIYGLRFASRRGYKNHRRIHRADVM